MFTVIYGGKQGKQMHLAESKDLIAVRTRTRQLLTESLESVAAPVSKKSLDLLQHFDVVEQFAQAGVEVLRAAVDSGAKALRDAARKSLKQEEVVRFAGRVLMDPTSRVPVLYTENFFVKFVDDAKASQCHETIKRHGLHERYKLRYAGKNSYFVSAPEGMGLEIFDAAQRLLEEDIVELCHPELVRPSRSRRAFPQQWHLMRTVINGKTIDASANVVDAWQLSQGEGIVVAIIDDGVDLDHKEFRGEGKIVAPRDVTSDNNNPRPRDGENHGTMCAGIAVANGEFGAAGVAPKAKLMPIRLRSGLGSQKEASAFVWAADNGADVISCSWGPVDGRWWDSKDPLHQQVVPLPDATRLAIDYAIRKGRNGKGCVILFAAGNGNESVDKDGYASYEKVIAVAACTDRSVRAVYSDFGKSIWCAFPSGDGYPSLTPGIWTTDRSGTVGDNPGDPRLGDAEGDFVNNANGTSSACPGVAGVAALILARNPDLRWDEVRDIIRRSCDQIDLPNGRYDQNGHSIYYGYGRVNARRAVELARPEPPAEKPQPQTVEVEVQKDTPIRDWRASQLIANVSETRALKDVRVSVDISHVSRGDLVVTLHPPLSLKVAPIVLHNRAGGALPDLKTTFTPATITALSQLCGKSPKGRWRLVVADRARGKQGVLHGFKLTFVV